MKQMILAYLIFWSLYSVAQVSINTSGTPPHSSAMVDITGANKGLLIPRMTSAVRISIASPAKGLIVMDTTVNSLFYFNGASWGELSSVKSNLWNISGNNIYNTNVGNIGIGTTAPNANALVHINLGTNLTNGFLVTGTTSFPAFSPPPLPDLGEGVRMMFYPGRGAFRAGYVNSTQWNNVNVGYFSTAIGYNTLASGYFSTAMGLLTTATNGASTAMGDSTSAIGGASTAMGSYTKASGENSTAMGYRTAANSSSSTALGDHTVAKGYSSLVIGMYNDSILLNNEFLSTVTTPLFIVGNGDANSIRSNAMVVRKNGNVEVENLIIGNGTNISKQQAGTATAGSNASGFKTYTLIFPSPFLTIPRIVATAKNDPGWSNINDTFVVSVRNISTTNVTFNIQRVDSNGGWSQNLLIDWMAWE